MGPWRRIRRFPYTRLLVAIAIGWLWWRSRAHTDVLAVFLHRGAAQVVASDRGRVLLVVTNVKCGSAAAYTYDSVSGETAEFDEVRVSLYEAPPQPERLAGVW